MEVTLRKAAALENALRSAATALPLTKQVKISIFADATVADSAKEVQAKLVQNAAEGVALIRAAFTIRQSIAETNAQSGISALLTEKAALDATEKLITSALGGKVNEYDEAVDLSIAQAQLDAARERAKAVVDRYSREDSITVNILTEEVTDGLRKQLTALKRRKTALADELLALNMGKKVTISAEIEALLKKHDLV